jgi:hypothetical protein
MERMTDEVGYMGIEYSRICRHKVGEEKKIKLEDWWC